MGTVIFPDADLKVFLTAAVRSRAERRHKQLMEKGFSANIDDLLRVLEERDRRDMTRAAAPLAPASDAVVIDSTGLTIDETVDRVLAVWSSRQLGRCRARIRIPGRRAGSLTVVGRARLESPASGSRCGRSGATTRVESVRGWQIATPPGPWGPGEINGKSMSTAVAEPPVKEESFAALFEESLKRQEMRQGEVITAEVIRVDHNYVVVNAGLKSESYVPVEEFYSDRGELEVKEGDFVSVAIDSLEDGFGETRLSRDRAKRLAAWVQLEQSLDSGDMVSGTVTGKVKGGLTVMTNGIRAFLPGSLIDTRPVKDTTPFEGKTLEFKVIKLDRRRNNVVLSRRAVIELSQGEERAKLLETLTEGAIVDGVVKNITDYGAFVDLGGIDGLLHITDMAWRRVRHPSEVLQVGQEIKAKVLKFDQEKNRVSLGIKQLGEDPWVGISRRYPQGTRMFGKVTEHHRLRRVRRDRAGHRGPGPRLGDGLDQQERQPRQGGRARRGSRGHGARDRRGSAPDLARHEAVPGQSVAGVQREPSPRRQGQRVRSSRSPTSACSSACPAASTVWSTCRTCRGTRPARTRSATSRRATKSTPSCSASTSSASASRSASSSSKAIRSPTSPSAHEKGSIVTGIVTNVDARGATIQIEAEVEGYLRASEIARDRVEDARNHLNQGDTVEAMIINIDRKNRSIALSIKAKDTADTAEALQKMQAETSASTGTTNLGALLRAKLDKQDGRQQQHITERIGVLPPVARRLP